MENLENLWYYLTGQGSCCDIPYVLQSEIDEGDCYLDREGGYIVVTLNGKPCKITLEEL